MTTVLNDRMAKLISRARELSTVVGERAEQCEVLRRILPETHKDFLDAGFYKILQPARYGGFDLEFGIQTDLAAEIGRGCASSAWVLSVISCHSWMVGMFPEQAQDDVWGDHPDAIISSSFLSMGPTSVKRTDGGYQLKGRWGFSSGADYCQAALLLVTIPLDSGKSREPALLLVPKSRYEVVDTWHATGLTGTGSNDLIIKEAFVPDHCVLRIKDTTGGPTPGSVINSGPNFKLPLFSVLPFNLVGAAFGAARGALDTIVVGLKEQSSSAQVVLKNQQSVQLRVAQVTALIETAWNALQPIRYKINSDANQGIVPSIETKTKYRLVLGHSAKLCVEAMDQLFPLMGGRGLSVGNPVQRAWRDVHSVAQHVGLIWDIQASNFGLVKLGLPCTDPLQ